MSAIPAGYKQTEVGVIPEGWAILRLEEIAAIATGNTPPTRDASNYGDEFLFVSPADLGIYKQVTNTQKRLSAKGFALSRCFPKDSILFVCIGSTIGKCGLAAVELATNQQINAIFPSPSFSTDYLYYTVCAASPKIRALAGEQAVPIVNKTQFSETQIPLPALPEQRAIATALSDVDALLAKLDQFIAKKRDLKQAAMQQLLTGQTRLPGFGGEWEVKRLYELAEQKKEFFDDGDWVEAEFLTENGVRLVQTGNVGEGAFIEKVSKKYISEESFTKLRCKALQVGDILICRLAEPAGRACVFPDIGENRVITAVDVTIFRPPSHLADRRYLVHAFNTQKWFSAINERCGGSTRTRIARGELAKIELTLPPVAEQTAIATVLCDMDAELTALEARRDKTRALKQGMMQDLPR